MIPRHLQIMLVLLVIAVLFVGYRIHRLQVREQRAARLAEVGKRVAAPLEGETYQATLVIAYDEEATLRAEQAALRLPSDPGQRALSLLTMVLDRYQSEPSPHRLPAEAEVRSVFLLPERDGRMATAVVDVNAAFADGHRSGILVENLTLASLMLTLQNNFPELRRVKFLVEGEERATLAGHADLRQFFELEHAAGMVAEVR